MNVTQEDEPRGWEPRVWTWARSEKPAACCALTISLLVGRSSYPWQKQTASCHVETRRTLGVRGFSTLCDNWVRGGTGGTGQAPTLAAPWSFKGCWSKRCRCTQTSWLLPQAHAAVWRLLFSCSKTWGSTRFVIITSSVMGEFEELRLQEKNEVWQESIIISKTHTNILYLKGLH